jgi:predicted transcriptional regulator
MAKLGRPKKYEGTETRITIRVDEKRRKRIEYYAGRDQSSMTAICETALEHYLNRRDGDLKRMGTRK